MSGGGQSRDARVEQSIECQIMDWADDAAYSMGDLHDGIRARFINADSVQGWAWANSSLDSEDSKSVDDLLAAMKSRTASRFVATKIGAFIKASGLKERSTNMDGVTNRYRYTLTKKPDMDKQRKLFKKLAFETVFKTPQVHQLEYKGDLILSRMFECFENNYITGSDGDKRRRILLPAETEKGVLGIERSEHQNGQGCCATTLLACRMILQFGRFGGCSSLTSARLSIWYRLGGWDIRTSSSFSNRKLHGSSEEG